MTKLYLRKRKSGLIEVDPQIIRWRNKPKPLITFERRPTLGRPKGSRKKKSIHNFFE